MLRENRSLVQALTVLMTYRILLGCFLGGLVMAAPAAASPTLSGLEGGLDFPSSEVRRDGLMTVGVAYAGTSASYVFPPYSNRLYFLSASVLPGVEVCARFTEVLGLYDPSIFLPNYVDRMIMAKWALPMPTGWPSLALGAVDLFSINELNNLPGLLPGTSRYGTMAFAVTGYQIGRLRWEVGYGQGKSYMQGPFTLVKLGLLDGVEALAEYGSDRWNVGLSVSTAAGFSVKAGCLQGKELGLATAYSFSL